MPDTAKDERIEFYLRVWILLNTTCWPSVKEWVERRINEELPDRESECSHEDSKDA